MKRDWNEHYATSNIPWDTGAPAPELVELFEAGRLPKGGRALDIGCGTGANVRYLSRLGFATVGVDISHLAIERAAAAAPAADSAELHQLDFLTDELPGGSFDLVFDRGCFHVFDDSGEQARFAARVAGCLADHGLWVSLLGSTEGPARDHGPPRRSARDIANAVEPALRILDLRGIVLDANLPTEVLGWVLLAGRREVSAQPSTS